MKINQPQITTNCRLDGLQKEAGGEGLWSRYQGCSIAFDALEPNDLLGCNLSRYVVNYLTPLSVRLELTGILGPRYWQKGWSRLVELMVGAMVFTIQNCRMDGHNLSDVSSNLGVWLLGRWLIATRRHKHFESTCRRHCWNFMVKGGPEPQTSLLDTVGINGLKLHLVIANRC